MYVQLTETDERIGQEMDRPSDAACKFLSNNLNFWSGKENIQGFSDPGHSHANCNY